MSDAGDEFLASLERLDKCISQFEALVAGLQGRLEARITFPFARARMNMRVVHSSQLGWIVEVADGTSSPNPEWRRLLDDARPSVKIACVARFPDLIEAMDNRQNELIAHIGWAVEFFNKEFGELVRTRLKKE